MMEEEPGLYYVEDTEPLISRSSINRDSSEITMSTAMKARDHENMSKKRVLRNLVVTGSSYFIFFLGFQSLSNLQSTMNSDGGVGMDSQALVYVCAMISCLLLPDLLIKKIGCKRTIVCMLLMSVPYIASNFNPSRIIIMPSSVLMGLAIGPLNSAGALYVNEMALRYHKIQPEESLDSTVSKFYGFFGFFSESTQIWGNLISYYVLSPSAAHILNHTNITCGIDFRFGGNSSNPNLEPPTEDKRFLLVSIYLLSTVTAATLMGLFTDKLDNDVGNGERSLGSGTTDRLLATIKQASVPDQILLLPISIFVGIELSFYTAEFTQAYIACSWGVHHVGFVTICFGVCGAIMSLLVGPLVKYISQMAVLILAACANIGICVLLFLWDPTPETTSIYFIIAGVWGMGDAIWWSQISALYGLMFPNDREAAFSNLYFWSFLGFFLSYSYANYLSVAVKINILMAFLLTGMACYLAGQIKIKCSARKEYIHIENGNQ
nr:UNC93-like protein [Parasteatoda tepidariorum]